MIHNTKTIPPSLPINWWCPSRVGAVYKDKKDAPFTQGPESKEIQANKQLHSDLEVMHGWRLHKKHG